MTTARIWPAKTRLAAYNARGTDFCDDCRARATASTTAAELTASAAANKEVPAKGGSYTMTMMLGYLRASTEEQANRRLGLEAQRDSIRRYADSKG